MPNQVKDKTIEDVKEQVEDVVEAIEELEKDADNVDEPVAEPVKKAKSNKHFYRSHLCGLTVLLNTHETDPTLNEEVRFVPYLEKWGGETIRMGYLETDDARVVERLAKDGNVQEIDEFEYKKYIDRAKRTNY